MKLVTDDQHSLWIGLEQGVIIALRYGPWTGESAVRKLETMPGGNLIIDPKLKLPQMLNLPPTSHLMARLYAAVAKAAAPDRKGSIEPAVAQASKEAPFEFQQAEFIAEMQRYLTGVLGPIAAMMVDRTVEAVGGIGSERQLQAFVEQMRNEADGFVSLEQFDQKMETLRDRFRET